MKNASLHSLTLSNAALPRAFHSAKDSADELESLSVLFDKAREEMVAAKSNIHSAFDWKNSDEDKELVDSQFAAFADHGKGNIEDALKKLRDIEQRVAFARQKAEEALRNLNNA